MKKEYSIMPENENYKTDRFNGSERNEIFGGNPNRQHSIDDGLVVFLTPEQHRTGKNSFHLNPDAWLWLKQLGQRTWQEHYNKTEEDFRKRYFRSYL
jgi:hypothetical protein